MRYNAVVTTRRIFSLPAALLFLASGVVVLDGCQAPSSNADLDGGPHEEAPSCTFVGGCPIYPLQQLYDCPESLPNGPPSLNCDQIGLVMHGSAAFCCHSTSTGGGGPQAQCPADPPASIAGTAWVPPGCPPRCVYIIDGGCPVVCLCGGAGTTGICTQDCTSDAG
jgi:hypothetical protein